MFKRVLLSLTATAVLGVASISVADAATSSDRAALTSASATAADQDAPATTCADGKRNRGRSGATKNRRAATIKTAAAAIGIDAKDLLTALKGGQSIAEVAADHDVDAQTVINALVAAASTKIDAKVESGDITQERADTLKQRLPEIAAKIVNHKRSSARSQAGVART